MAREHDLPPLVDFGDAIDNIEREVDTDDRGGDDPDVGVDVSEHVARLREQLDRLKERGDQQSREGVLDDIDNTVLSLREALEEGSTADQYAQGIQNRIQQYRTNREAGSETLTLSRVRLEHNGVAIDVADKQGETAVLRGTLVNGGDDSDALVVLSFYDEGGAVCRTVEHYQRALAADEQRDVECTVYVPPTAAHYAVRAMDTADGRALSGAEPVPDELARERAEDDDEGPDDGRPASERSAEEITDDQN
ncbi:hypothetical protein [Halomarina litorea]|uniref:hypothetical protein n=1 Tax=Halomarina litorea TaxID=2961595 RepID=UPI0020C41DFB|nr:hypothetical protein [Halomarina sp. BCD28]